jgi:predicted lipoprotein
VLASLADHVVLGRYAEFDERAAALAAAASALCDQPSDSALAAARDAWWSAHEPWKRTEIVKFGPVVEYPDRLGPKLDDWPVNAAAVEELVASDDALDFAAMGSATRGLPVVEYLLWAGGGDSSDALAALTADPRRCAVLAGAAADTGTSAAQLHAVWRDDWAARIGAPGPGEGDPWETAQDAVDEWVNRMVFTVENVRAGKLGKPLGDGSGGDALLDALESRYSGRSLLDARDALQGVRDVWTGTVWTGTVWTGDGGEHPGIDALAAGDPQLVERVGALFDEAEVRTAEIPETLEESITREPEIVTRAQVALQALQVILQVELAQELSVTITFNDNDGD